MNSGKAFMLKNLSATVDSRRGVTVETQLPTVWPRVRTAARVAARAPAVYKFLNSGVLTNSLQIN